VCVKASAAARLRSSRLVGRNGFSIAGLLLDYGQTGMYGPPLCRKRKMRVTGWSAQTLNRFHAIIQSVLLLTELAHPTVYADAFDFSRYPPGNLIDLGQLGIPLSLLSVALNDCTGSADNRSCPTGILCAQDPSLFHKLLKSERVRILARDNHVGACNVLRAVFRKARADSRTACMAGVAALLHAG
jgi:hypothetical protein